MGIQSLTSLVNHNEHLLNEYKLQNTSVVIDGSNIMYRIYETCRIDSRYGGDYKSFEKNCKKFLNNLRRCNVEPIIFFDGTLEQTGVKLETSIKRAESRITDAKSLSLGVNGRQVLPLFAVNVFVNVLKTLTVEFYQCAGEADAYIASKANSIGCPVISLDSDFFIFDLKYGYIPFDSIDWTDVVGYDSNEDTVPHSASSSATVNSPTAAHSSSSMTVDQSVASSTVAVAYQKSSNQIHRTSAPVVAVPHMSSCIYHLDNLLGCFKNLDRSVLPLFATVMGNDFIKPSNFTNFVKQVPKEPTKRRTETAGTKRHNSMIGILNWLQGKNVDQATSDVLLSVKKERRANLEKMIKFSVKLYDDFEKINGTALDVDEECRKNLSYLYLPEWFLDAYLDCNIPLPFIGILIRRKVILPTLVEDFSRTSVYFCCRSIRQASYCILLREQKEDASSSPPSVFEYLRHGGEIIKQEVKTSPCFDHLPSLKRVENVDIDERLKIFYDVIGLNCETVEKIKKFPSFLAQFLCVTSFWIRNEGTKIERGYFDALITCTYVRLLKYCIDDDWLKFGFVPSSLASDDVHNFVEAVQKFDFTPKMDSKKPYKPDVSILHAFNQWQAIAYSFQFLIAALNLLRLPSSDFNVENCFSGRLCYNLAKTFSSSKDFRIGLKKIYAINEDESTTVKRLVDFRSVVLNVVSGDFHETNAVPAVTTAKSQLKKLTKKKLVDVVRRNSVEIDGECVELKDADDDVDVCLANNKFAALRLL